MRMHSIAMAALLTACVVAPVQAAVADRETPAIGGSGDADDPAIWLHPSDLSKSLVITAVKDAGGRVYDLGAGQVQVLSPFPATSGSSRINNVDVQYGFRLFDGRRVDIAVGSDRGQDVLRVWTIDGDAARPLAYIGNANPSRAFPNLPDGNPNPLSDQNTVYGLTLYRDVAADRMYALASQRGQPRVAQFELVALDDGTVDTRWVRAWDFAAMTVDGTPVDLAGLQFEGLVVDQQSGMLYAAQEDVGIWRIDLNTGAADSNPFVLTRSYTPASPLQPDVEGLTIYYGANGAGYLLASSQGDDSFAVFDRQAGNAHLGTFSITAGAYDAVQQSDGADVTNITLPGYPQGLFITQDGNNTPERGTNFKYVSWADIAGPLKLTVDTTAYDPRNPLPVPEPQTWLMLLAGLGLVGHLSRHRR